MGIVTLPTPRVRRPPAPGTPDPAVLASDLADAVRGEVRFDDGTRAIYATDSSNYRQVPIGVVLPADVDDAVAAVRVCREHAAPVLSRGGGTSLAGECCNVAVILDWSKYVNQVERIDTHRRTAIVQPGMVLDELNRATRAAGPDRLVFGPKPATHNHCTVGGMIGNNSCGFTAQWSGTTSANVERLEILTYDGTRMWVGRTSDQEYRRIQAGGGRPAEIYRRLRDLRDAYAEQIRRRFPPIKRRISGFNLVDLLPEHGFNLAGALVGTESTCVTVLRAELRLLSEPKHTVLVLLGFDDIASAADKVPELNRYRPVVLEGMDDKLIRYERMEHLHPEALKLFAGRGGWLMAEFGGDTMDEALAAANQVRDALGHGDAHVITDPAVSRQIWKVRESGLGATARTPGGGPDTWPGWEDSAVPVDSLGDYLREFGKLLRGYGYDAASLYGHFGQGCLHTSIPFDLVTTQGVRDFRSFVERAADLCVHYGGSFSGEHGDGQARGELLPRMYGDGIVRAFGEFKAIFDPDNKMNPGKVVHPNPLDGQLRLGPDYAPAEPPTYFRYPEDRNSFSRAALRCAGVGECRRHHPEGGVMCPSYQVTRDEEHSTRGRARALFEMARGETITDGWRSEAVADALDLCLACKGCKKDCPMEVDMATYKAEFLSHHYAGRLRPRDHYALGWLPVATRLAALAPELANALTQTPALARLAKWAGGIDQWRPMPRFAGYGFRRWFDRHPPGGDGSRGEVVLWPDTFTTAFSPGIAAAAVLAMESAGFRVLLPPRNLCCGLTWISTGQLGIARRVLRRTVTALAPYTRAGLPVIGLEPSCTAVFRSDLVELLEYRLDARRLAGQTRTFAELLTERAPGFAPRLTASDGTPTASDGTPTASDGQGRIRAIVQTHCHQHAILGYDADRELMDRIGLDATVLDSGCCGLAGNFGMVPQHRDVSLACAEQALLPAVRDATAETLVIADGFSCRTQIEDAGAGRRPVHVAEAVAAAVRGDRLGPYPERVMAFRPGDRRAVRT